MPEEFDSVKEYYESRFAKGDYGKEAVYLNPDPNHYHQKIIKIIKNLSQNKPLKILDVGCATGYLGAAVKMDKNYVCGVEISEKAASEAKKVLDDVIVGNIEEVELPYPKEYFDIIICSDIIEHLFDPKKTLVKLRDYLKPDGKLLMVVPNVAYYKIRLMLLRGKWEYKEYGIMDYGHIRWFTKDTGSRLLRETGFYIEKIIPYIVLPLPIRIIDKYTKNYLTKLFEKTFDTLLSQTFLYIAKKV